MSCGARRYLPQVSAPVSAKIYAIPLRRDYMEWEISSKIIRPARVTQVSHAWPDYQTNVSVSPANMESTPQRKMNHSLPDDSRPANEVFGDIFDNNIFLDTGQVPPLPLPVGAYNISANTGTQYDMLPWLETRHELLQ